MSRTPEKTRWMIAEALKELLKTKALEHITVNEIIEWADVSRPTFYRYFKDKYDLVNWYFRKLCDRSFFLMGKSLTLREALTRKFDYLKSEQNFFVAAFQSQEQNSLTEYDYECIYAFYTDYLRRQNGEELSKNVRFVLEMYCRGSIDMTARWARGGMKEEPEEIVEGLILALPKILEVKFRGLTQKNSQNRIDDDLI